MTDSVHPTADELADLQAGLLSGDELARLRSHVEGCRSCAAELAAIDEVAAHLAEAGTEPLPMPADVSASLDAALARASSERAAGVPSLDAKREHRRRAPWVLIGGAAAAAVFVIGAIGLGGLPGIQGTDDSDNAGGSSADSGSLDSGGDSLAQGDAPKDSSDNGAGSGQEYSQADQAVTRATLARFARHATNRRTESQALGITAGCRAELPPSTRRSLATEVAWEGEPAVVVIDPADRTATVFGCGTGPEPLYSTSY